MSQPETQDDRGQVGQTPATINRESGGQDAPPTTPMGAPTVQSAAVAADVAGGAPAVPARYRVVQELGRGGMGVVYRAHDGTLGRDVAFKVLLLGGRVDAEAIGRFGREARAAAALDHPGIVRVHDVGALPDGRPYYTMELLAGRDLAGAISGGGIAPRDAVEAVRQVALALAFAHGRGILHRDIKPQNIFLRRDPMDEPRADAPTIPSGAVAPPSDVRALLLDFGLAKLSEGNLAAHAGGSEARRSLQSLTRSGEVFGTPAYMPPEQARDAKAVDARADVYSLGASLYHALAGRPPFDAPSLADLLEKVQKVDPPPPSAWSAEVDADLDTICLKCLAKEPKDRYQTAADLAEDCRRWLADEPIIARPVGLVGRVWRKAKRNQVVSILIVLAGVALVATTATGIVSWRTHVKAQASEREAKESVDRYLTELSRSGDALVEAALAWRAKGELARSRTFSDGVEGPVRELIARAPRLAEPYYYRGRMLHALQRNAEAEEAQDKAVRLAFAPDASEGSRAVLWPALYERGVLRAARYQRTLEEMRQEMVRSRAAGKDTLAPPPPVPDTAEVEAENPEVAELRRSAVEDLRRVVDLASPDETAQARAEAARGIVALLSEGSEEAAKGHLTRALELDRYMQEVYTALAGLATKRGSWEEAASWYENGHAADVGYLPYLTDLADVLWRAMQQAESEGKEGEEYRRRELAALDEAVKTDPDHGEAWRRIGEDRWYEGQALSRRGSDPTEVYEMALAACEKALSIDRSSAEAANDTANIYASQGEWLRGRGKDPTAIYAKALAGYEKALSINPGCAEAANNEAEVYRLEGSWLSGHGKDPSEAYTKALVACEKALSLNPRYAEAAYNEAVVYWSQGDWLRGQGRDPSEAHAQALAECGRALSINPMFAEAANIEACVRQSQGIWLCAQGKDPCEAYTNALAACERALSINPRLAEAANTEAVVYQSQGDWLLGQGKDPSETYSKALVACEKALSLNPRYAHAANNTANVYASQGEWLRGRGKDPTEAYTKALAGYERALSIDPGDSEAACNAAGVFGREGDWLRAQGQDPSEAYTKALMRYEKALSINPRLAEAAYSEEVVCQRQGDWLTTQGKDPSKAYAKALAACEKALSINSKYAEAIATEGVVYQSQGEWLRGQGKDPIEAYTKALAGYEKALSLNAAFWQAHANKGIVFERMGRLNDAITSYEAALRICPGDPQVKALLDAALARRQGVAGVPRGFAEADAALARGDYRTAAAGYEDALRSLDDKRLAASATLPAAARNAHYNLACIRSLASVGKDGPAAEAKPIDGDAAARVREDAFRHLRQAIDLGYADLKHLAEDADLVPLHDDPRWADVVKRLTGK